MTNTETVKEKPKESSKGESPKGFSSASEDLSSVAGRSPAVPHGHTNYDPAAYQQMINSGGQPRPGIPVTSVIGNIKTPPFHPYESRSRFVDGKDKVPPSGFVPLDKVPYEYADFLLMLRSDPRLQTSIWLDEPCPVFFQGATSSEVREIKPHKETMITGIEFLCWFFPEYQVHRESSPSEIDPGEWSRMKKHLLEQCFRHPSQRPLPDKDGKSKFSGGGKIETTNEKFRVFGMIPKVWIGAKVNYEMTVKPRQTLLQAVVSIMHDNDIPFEKTSFTPQEVERVADSLASDAELYGIKEIIGNHFKSSDDRQAADWFLVPLMKKAAEEQRTRVRGT